MAKLLPSRMRGNIGSSRLGGSLASPAFNGLLGASTTKVATQAARGINREERQAQLQWNPHGAASCRFATRPVLRTRPGHPKPSPRALHY